MSGISVKVKKQKELKRELKVSVPSSVVEAKKTKIDPRGGCENRKKPKQVLCSVTSFVSVKPRKKNKNYKFCVDLIFSIKTSKDCP